MQDIHQIEAFRIPLHVELTELLGFYFDLVQNCDCEIHTNLHSDSDTYTDSD